MTILRANTEEQKAMLHLLDEARKQVEAGHMKTMAVIACMEKGPAWVMAGRDAASLYLAAGMMQDDIKEKLKASENQAVARAVSSIVKPRIVS
jgi:hypothetical protein